MPVSIVDNHLDHLVLRDRELCSGGHISHPVCEVIKVLICFHFLLGHLHDGWEHFDAMAELSDEGEGHLSKSLGLSHRQFGHLGKGIPSKRLKEQVGE